MIKISADFVKLASRMYDIEKLRQHVIARRIQLRLSQRDLAQVSGVKAATIASLEAGRVSRAPTIETLRGLEQGLREPPGTLLAILEGKTPNHQKVIIPLSPPSAQGKETPDEGRIMADAQRLGIGFPKLQDPNFWDLTAAQRKPTFRALELLIEETIRVQEIQDRGGI